MFIINQSTQSWYRHITYLHVLHVSTYYGHHQVYNSLYNHPSIYLLYLPTLASVYTLGARCTGMLFKTDDGPLTTQLITNANKFDFCYTLLSWR
jgi:hypothetical protein